MKINPVAKICSGQDGTIWGDYLFRFNAKGICKVYEVSTLLSQHPDGTLTAELSSFTLDKSDVIVPHSNAVMFGTEYYCADDEFPLLYSNIYNNYSKQENPLKGVCCVYRLQRSGIHFTTTLVQLIEIGFTDDPRYWCSADHSDIRPYGNFTIDRDSNIYYAFTMCDKEKETRYFSFPLPGLADGIMDADFQVKKVTLNFSDCTDYFNCEYHRFVQGACCQNGKIYSLEGFTNSKENPPALRIINPKTKMQELCIEFAQFGLTVEPEFIEFKDGVCYYSDCGGNVYTIEF